MLPDTGDKAAGRRDSPGSVCSSEKPPQALAEVAGLAVVVPLRGVGLVPAFDLVPSLCGGLDAGPEDGVPGCRVGVEWALIGAWHHAPPAEQLTTEVARTARRKSRSRRHS